MVTFIETKKKKINKTIRTSWLFNSLQPPQPYPMPLIREFKIPRRQWQKKRPLKTDFVIYETLAQLSELCYYALFRQTLQEVHS